MQEITEYGLYAEFPADLPEAGPRTLREQFAALTPVLQRWDAAERRLLADPHLTEVDRRAQLAELTRTETAAVDHALAGRFDTWTRAALQAEIEQTRAALALRFDLPPTATDAERQQARLEEHWAREALGAMAPGDRYLAVREAARRNDVATLRTARGTPLATPEQWAQVDRLNLAQHHGARTTALTRLEKLAEVLDENARIARKTVRGEGRRRVGVAR